MISSKLKGGLGNQLFQISAAYALARKNGVSAVFKFEESKIMDWAQGNKATTYVNTLYRKLQTDSSFKEEKIFKEVAGRFHTVPYEPGLLLDGYFQSEEYFKEFSIEVKNLFSITKEEKEIVWNYLKQFSSPVVSIHIRRGDYLSEKMKDVFADIGTNYYTEAMEKAKSLHGANVVFVVVSDDLLWARASIKGENVHFSPFTRDIDDFNLMRESNHNIITNSTFSWWAAYLNTNPNKTIIMPKDWFGGRGPPKPEGLYLSDWIVL
jgi:hypothetical protein